MTSCGLLQPVSDTTSLQLQKDVELVERTNIELYLRTNEWFVKTFVCSESIIEFQSEEVGKILGKYVIIYFEPAALGNVNQTISMQVKDEKGDFTFTNPYDSKFVNVADIWP